MSSTSGMSDWQREWLKRAFQAETTQGTVPVTTQPAQMDTFTLLEARRLAFLLWRMARESGIDGYQVRGVAADEAQGEGA